MTLDADIIENASPAEPRATDPRIARAEMWLCMLRGLVQIGLWLIGAANREAGGKGSGLPWRGPRIVLPFGFDPGLVFARVSRAVCLAIMLSARIGDEIAAMRAGRFPSDPAPTPLRMPMGDLPEPDAVAARLADSIREIGLETLIEDVEPCGCAEALLTDLTERLGEERMDPAFYRLLNGPIKDAVAAICADLGLRPDWSQWTEDGFPPPPGGEVTEWRIFLTPKRDTRPVRSSGEPGPMAPPPGDTGGEGEIVWRPRWRRRESDNPQPPPSRTARASPNRGGSPCHAATPSH
jgi:hypothetical protein